MVVVVTMKNLVLLYICQAAIWTVAYSISVYEEGIEADVCTADVCKAEDGCRCATSQNPLQSEEPSPQLISLTFDEALTDELFTDYWQPLLFGRVNPDGQQISGTFFVPHEFTDYERVNDLYNHGFEIGVHSITRNNLVSYWPRASKELLEKEFGGQRHIASKFGNIPKEDIIGARTPQLQLAANNSMAAYQAVGLQYDSSWPTLPDSPLFPYTLDYLSPQKCLLGVKCPNEAFEGFWVLPINDLHTQDGKWECTTVTACNVTGTADEIADWLLNEINQIRESTRIPLTLLIHSYWFEFIENSLEAFAKVLDKIAEYKDVFLVSQKLVLEWMKNPIPLSQFKTDNSERNAACNPYSCKLKRPDGVDRNMKSCIPCPANYPWLGNPDGN